MIKSSLCRCRCGRSSYLHTAFDSVFRFMPELILEGHVYVAMPPLYKAIPSKGEEKYLYDDAEL